MRVKKKRKQKSKSLFTIIEFTTDCGRKEDSMCKKGDVGMDGDVEIFILGS